MSGDNTLDAGQKHSKLREHFLSAMMSGDLTVPESLPMPLSYEQQRMWYSEQTESNERFYNLYNALRIHGKINADALERVFQTIIERHEILRTIFLDQNGIPKQKVIPISELVRFKLVREKVENCEKQFLENRFECERNHLFSLQDGGLLRASLLSFSIDQHILIVNMHHIIADGWSINNFIRELVYLYSEYCANDIEAVKHLPELEVQYSDFALWQDVWLQTDYCRVQLNYWRKRLAGIKPLPLVLDKPRPKYKTFSGSSIEIHIPNNLSGALKGQARESGATLFSALLAIFNLALHKQCGATDIAIGTSVSGRDFPVLEPLIGLFLNQIVIRTDLSLNPSIRQVLSLVHTATTEGIENSNVPFDSVVNTIVQERSTNRSPLFDVLLTLQNSPNGSMSLDGVDIEPIPISLTSAKFDLSWFFSEHDEGISGTLVYNTDLFTLESAKTMSEDFIEMAKLMADKPDTLLNQVKNSAGISQEGTTEKIVKESKFKKRNRKTINLSDVSFVNETELTPLGPFALIAESSHINIYEWLKERKNHIEAKLMKYGAILLRGFNLGEISRFEEIMKVICDEVIIGYGDLPEEKGTKKVYGSTPYPADKTILYHSESSHLQSWPTKQCFACVTPSKIGGETPIVDCRIIYNKLSDSIRKKFSEKGLLYVRNFIPGLDVSWQNFYKTDDRKVAEDKILAGGGRFAWLNDGTLSTERYAQAVDKHPLTNDLVFFNQIMLHHPHYLSEEERDALTGLYGKDKMPRSVYYGDGEPIESTVLDELLEIYQETSIAFPWQKGDLLICDNMLIAHARNPFEGERKIIVGMGDPIDRYRTSV